MKKLCLILAVALVLLVPAFAENAPLTMSGYLTDSPESVTTVRMVFGEKNITLTDEDKITEFFKICDNLILEKNDQNQAESNVEGLFIETEGSGNNIGFGYISDLGYADKYALFMSRLPAKAYKIKGDAASTCIADLLALGGDFGFKCSDWAKNSVIEFENKNICSFSDYTLPATRLEFCEMLYKYMVFENISLSAAENDKPASFTDCDSEAARIFCDCGVINGTGENLFSPNAEITREEAAVIVYRLALKLKFDRFLENYMLSSYMYEDGGQFSDWSVEPITLLQAAGIISGVGDDRFAPKDTFTREQSAELTKKLFYALSVNATDSFAEK